MKNTPDIAPRKIYKIAGGEEVGFEEAVLSWRGFFSFHIQDCYESTLSMVERCRLHIQFNSAWPRTPIELQLFERFQAAGSFKSTNWAEALPLFEHSLALLRPFYFHFDTEIKVLDWRNEETVATFAKLCEDCLKNHVLMGIWWEQSGLDYGDLLEK